MTTLPVIVGIIFWSEIMTTRLNRKEVVTAADSFYRDLFMINYATLFAFNTSLLFEHYNSDVRGW